MNTLNESILKVLSENIPGESNQILLVMGDHAKSSSANLYPLERHHGEWVSVFQPIRAVAGKNGFALPGEKREGDGKTPQGIYPLKFAFGYDRTIKTGLDYRQATVDDVWVDDVNSSDYNTWVKKSETKAASYEEMRRTDNLYKYGIVIGYNTNPVVKGRGSAIFFHVWEEANVPTSGCIAVAETDIATILTWLDASQKPLAVLETTESMNQTGKTLKNSLD